MRCSSPFKCPLLKVRPNLGQTCDLSRQAGVRAGQRRCFQTESPPRTRTPRFAFAFDIDGVLLRGSNVLPGAAKTLAFLQRKRIPFVLLTNGGGYDEHIRAEKLSKAFDMPINSEMIVQSHTPFADMEDLKHKTVLIAGGQYDDCRAVATKYGFTSVVTPSDIFHAHPAICPFSRVFDSYHNRECKPRALPKPIDPSDLASSLKIDAMFVYNDPRDWQLDTTIILDCLLSHQGVLGTLSKKNGDRSLPNNGYLQDGQPELYFSNPDLWFAAEFGLPRLGQGGFREALEGVWAAATGGPRDGAELKKHIIGKPYQFTFQFAEKKLNNHRLELFGDTSSETLEQVFMVGDNLESDIKGANAYKSPFGTKWHSALVRTGVYSGGPLSTQPSTIVDDVQSAVQWGLETAAWVDGVD